MSNIHYSNASNDQRSFIEDRINSACVAHQGSLVDDLMGKDDEWSWDNVAGLRPDPSDWGLAQCREYLDAHGIDVPEVVGETEDDIVADDLIEQLLEQAAEVWGHRAPGGGNAPDVDRGELLAWLAAVKGEVDDTVCEIDVRVRYHDGGYVFLSGDASYDQDHRGFCAAASVGYHEEDTIEMWQEQVEDKASDTEVLEWWLITDDWVHGHLRRVGEAVLDNAYGTWWGRSCSGQAISLDPTFWGIYQQRLQGMEAGAEG
jgi:hypothetical protein